MSLAPASAFDIQTAIADGAREFAVTFDGHTRTYRLNGGDQNAYIDLFSAFARDFGARAPVSRRPFEPPAAAAVLHPLLTEPVSPDILYGYGDPCVLKDGDGWWLTCTSNDAPDAFPILYSADLRIWAPRGFVFPRGSTPRWALTGGGKADFWAPEMHKVGAEYWVCFTARRQNRELAIGLAKGPSPAGPFTAQPEPILAGGVIDAHLLVEPSQAPLLFWKQDSNAVWPRLLAGLLAREPALAERLFNTEPDRRTARLTAALWRWARGTEPMEQFFVLQPLIEAAVDEFSACEWRLRNEAAHRPDLAPDIFAILSAMKTKVYAQALSEDGSRLTGEPTLIVENDQTWEAHLIEGVWVQPHGGRYYLFYSGNDFSTHHYGIGSAVADNALGPYVKTQPLLRSTTLWSGPGHPSVAEGPDGKPWLFLHAFKAGEMGYKAFRALLAAPLAFGPEGPKLD